MVGLAKISCWVAVECGSDDLFSCWLHACPFLSPKISIRALKTQSFLRFVVEGADRIWGEIRRSLLQTKSLGIRRHSFRVCLTRLRRRH